MQSMSEDDQSNALLAHDVVNKLSAIVGLCDLLIERTEVGSEAGSHLASILELAKAAATELKEFQHQLAARVQSAKQPKNDVA